MVFNGRRGMSSGRRTSPEARVIRRKVVVPPRPERLVARPRIDGLLAELIEAHPLVWVCATAGAGKTTAVMQAVPLLDRGVAWLTLDDTDRAAGRLVTYLEAALGAQVASVAGVATQALAARLPHTEAAGLLAEAVGETPVVLVIDELERLEGAPEALAVIAALLRYAPPALRVVLISRREVPIALGSSAALGGGVTVAEADLAFRTEEAAEALAQAGRGDIDPAEAVEATGGWVAGVLFEAWRSVEHVVGVGGEADALHGYLSSQILDQLEDDEREFLITTSLLDDVTAERAEALGEHDAAERLVSLRAKHLPVAWRPDGHSMRCHARLREYLLERLERRGPAAVRELRAAHGELLADEGLYEDAVEEFLRARLPERAVEPAERSIHQVIDRLDYAVAERWLSALADVPKASGATLAVAELMLAIGREDYRRGGRVADRLQLVGERDRLARESPQAAAMMAWSYWHLGRWQDAREVGLAADDSPEMDAVRFTLNLVDHTIVPDHSLDPRLSGGPLDVLVMRVSYAHGRLKALSDMLPRSGWAAAVTAPWRIGCLRAMGHPEQALVLYEDARIADWAHVWLHAMVGPEILIDLGRAEEARAALARGREMTRACGSVVFEMLNELIAAKLEVRLEGDPDAAIATLDRLEQRNAAREYRFIAEQADLWRGLALLMKNDDSEALGLLEAAVETMQAGDRLLELPTAAVYLSEARWRAGDEAGADAAAALAFDAAQRQGSNHYLLRALATFPAVVARMIDAERSTDSPWHALARDLRSQGIAPDPRLKAHVELREFGELEILVDGRPAPRPRIIKSYELLAYLTSRGSTEVPRDELLTALFEGRSDESARSYLRQAIHQLREVLPDEVELISDATHVRVAESVRIAGDSATLEALLAEAARLQGEERLKATARALALSDRGEYLPGITSGWAEERREELATLAADARQQAAELAFEMGRYADAERLVDAVLRADSFREGAWRLSMRIAAATGDDDRVIAAYRACQRALAQLGTAPSDSTRQLLERLRR
jgi:LuxR family transcriptional regulator, maltose regulon positive regulatory protein